jgi:D-alanyl-D-alanine-carboxypeptidase/D-alanyl-D-alanine-endopeptidase
MKTFLMVVALAAPVVMPLAAQSRNLPADSTVLAIVRQRVDEKHNAGIVVGLLHRGERPRVVAYGIGVAGQRLDGNSVFEIGSVTKTFTATVLADMVRRGEVRLDEPVAKYLPASVHIPTRNGKEITFIDLSTQSSGLPRMPTNFAPKNAANPYADYDSDRLFAFLGSYVLPRDIGTQFEYSNLGVGLLGVTLAARDATGYEAMMRRRVLDPLGMRDTRIQLTPEMQEHLAPGHNPAGMPVANWDLDALAGAGAIRSTANDMLKYLAANLDSTNRPLGPAMHDAHRPLRPAGGMRIGLNWLVLSGAGPDITWHNGGTGGYTTFIGFDELNGNGVVVLSNTATSVDDIGMHLLDAQRPLMVFPKARTEMALPTAALERYVGDFAVTPAFHLVITRDGATLWAQATGQGKVQLFAEKENEFFLKVVDAQVSFTTDSSGSVTGLVLHQNGSNLPGRKIPQ